MRQLECEGLIDPKQFLQHPDIGFASARAQHGAGIFIGKVQRGQREIGALFPYYAANNGNLNKIDHCAYFALAAQYFPNENARAVLSAGTCKSDMWMLQKLFGVN